MSKTNSRKISEPRSNKSLFVPTLLSIALLSAFSSSALANSGGYYLETTIGGSSYYGNEDNLTNNEVTVNTGFETIIPVYGAYTEDNDKDVSGNKVTVSGSTIVSKIPSTVYGSFIHIENSDVSVTSKANQNTVTISDGVVSGGNVRAGYIQVNADGTASAEANDNTVTFSQFEIDEVRGGRVEAKSYNANATSRSNGNEVIIKDGSTVRGLVAGSYLYATADNGEALGEANDNTVTIDHSTVGGTVYGGYSNSTSEEADSGAALAEANENRVTISQATVQNVVYGGNGYAYTYGSDGTTEAYANYNTVAVLDGATVKGDIYGGYADGYADAYADAYAGKSNTEQASYNTVIIDSSTVKSDDPSNQIVIAGGAVWMTEDSDSLTATHNTVNISGTYTIDGASLWGGFDQGNGPSLDYDLFTGNTLNLDARQQNGTTAVKQVGNFETINIKAGNVTNGAVILDATGGAELGDGNKGTTVNLLSVDTGSLDAGNYITLISGVEDGGKLANDGQKQFVPIGDSIALGYIGQTNLETGDVVFNIEGKGANPKTKVLNESRAAEMAFLNSAADLLQDQDIHKAGKHVFGAVRGIYNKYKTGSSVDISGVGLVTGVANTWAGDSADLTGAVFVEAGWGSFDTKNDIMGSVQRGDGDSHYYGTGLIAKFDVTQGLFSGLYAEAAAHVGIISTDYTNAGLSSLTGQTASYDTDSLYYAAHATAGYRWNMTDKFDLDLSATYLWNYLESQEVRIAADKFDFDSVQSHRMRLAAEVGYTADKGFRPYAGVAWEREFDGEAGGSVDGVRLEEADLGGDSGLAWAGVSFEPKEGGPVKADAEITTYFGQRKGVSGRIWVRYEF
jgi:hypothetical protein